LAATEPQAGCDPEELFCILIQNQFSLTAVRQAMGDHDPTLVPVIRGTPAWVDHKAIAETRITHASKYPQAWPFPSDQIQLYIVDDFLSSRDCDALSDVIRGCLRPSTITTAQTEPDKYFRTSATYDLGTIENAFLSELDQKISRTVGIRLPYSEASQGHVYGVGEQFKAHTDYFEPRGAVHARHRALRGNRTWTFMIYLNDVAKGGGTHFIRLGYTFQPKKGRALAWNNLYANGVLNYNTLHAGLPVEEGYKIIITKWFRETRQRPHVLLRVVRSVTNTPQLPPMRQSAKRFRELPGVLSAPLRAS
jgi:prolyl 4-hydroxylase